MVVFIYVRWDHIVDLDKQNVRLHYYVLVFEMISFSFTIRKILQWQWLVYVCASSSIHWTILLALDKQMVRLLCLIAVITFGCHDLALTIICCQIILPGTTRTTIVPWIYFRRCWHCTNSAYVVLGARPVSCLNVRNARSIIIISSSLTVKIYYDIDDRCVLSSSVPWTMAFTMVEQIVPFYLLILWIAVLLSKSMVESVRLCARVRT